MKQVRWAAIAAVAIWGAGMPALAQQGLAEMPPPVDPESWTLPEWMTWDDYRPIPGVDWNDPARQPLRKLRSALILGDFADREFVVTMPEGSDVFGIDGEHNPIGVGAIAREQVGAFYADLLIRAPAEINHFHTVNEYWLEDSYGLIGVDATPFGPYRMVGKEHEYGLADYAANACPEGDDCGRDFDTELIQASLADVTLGIALNGGEDYDFRFLLHAGYDESGVWQEFGPMLFPDREDVPDALGNPDPAKPEWSSTRYVDWTSFAAAEGIWSHAVPGVTSTQAESDGASTFAHELSHIFGVLDNYNNPYAENPRRAYTGLWEMLSRGTFNGPGGTHQRWRIPPTRAGTMGAHHMLRNKIRLGFIKPNEVMEMPREALALAGPQVATIYPRAYPLLPATPDTGLHGMHILMGEDRAPACDPAEQFDCDGGGYVSYTVEVVDRIGYDSFTPDHGVLIAKNKDLADLAPFEWAIDAHPEDINGRVPPPPNADRAIYDYLLPTEVPATLRWPDAGDRVPITRGDPRQLADALFHAGTGDGVVSEFVDEANGLHFYVLDTAVDGRGVRTYSVGVRAAGSPAALVPVLEAAGVTAGRADPGRVAEAIAQLRNSGSITALVRVAASHPQGWTTHLRHGVVAVPAGATVAIPVYVAVPADGAGTTEVAFTGTVEGSAEALALGLPVVSAGEEKATAFGGGAMGMWLLLGLLLLNPPGRKARDPLFQRG